jgi:hypothetical protein
MRADTGRCEGGQMGRCEGGQVQVQAGEGKGRHEDGQG